MIGGAFEGLMNTIIVLFILVVIFAICGIYGVIKFFDKKTTVESQNPPAISWKLKTNGKTVDTVWIYKFKK